MAWLKDFFLVAARWVLKNPLLIILIIVIGLYNRFVPDLGLDTSAIDPFHAESIWLFTLQAMNFIFSTKGFVLMSLSLAATAFLTMLNTGALFAVFAGKPFPTREAVRTAFSFATVEYFILQALLGLIFGLLFLFGMWLVVPTGGLTGIFGSLIIGFCTAFAYPIFYVLLSTGSLIVAAPVSITERFTFSQVLFGKKNLPRITMFYLIRIGAETVAVYIVLILGRLLHLPLFIAGILAAIAVSIPFALVRTTGLVMKLDMLRDTPWFATYFKKYYESSGA